MQERAMRYYENVPAAPPKPETPPAEARSEAQPPSPPPSLQASVSASPSTNAVDDAIRAAAKACIDAGDLARARALLDLLDAKPTAPVLSIVREQKKT
jgi:hypothetical protein